LIELLEGELGRVGTDITSMYFEECLVDGREACKTGTTPHIPDTEGASSTEFTVQYIMRNSTSLISYSIDHSEITISYELTRL